MMFRTLTLAAGLLATIAFVVVAQPLPPNAPAPVDRNEPSPPQFSSTPETAVPRSLSFWPVISRGQLGDCEPGEPIDNTTLVEVRRHIETAGFTDARELHKGCDNIWHGSATASGGRQVFVLVDPHGDVLTESTR